MRNISLFEESEKKEIEMQISELKNELDYDTRDFPIDYLVEKYKKEVDSDYSGASIVIPEYQRHEELWSPKAMSRFIESLLLGYPIPLIFLAETADGLLEIIDGLQRISTLSKVFNEKDDFVFIGLKKLTSLNGKTLSQLPVSEVRKLSVKALRIIVLSDKTPEEVRSDLFYRLNTSSLKTKSSENRSSWKNNNFMSKIVIPLTKDSQFKKLVNLTTNNLSRKGDEELIERFFAFSENYQQFEHGVDVFISDFIRKIVETDNWSEIEERYKREFKGVMSFVEQNFEYGFTKGIKTNGDWQTTPNVRFEALAVGINLAMREKTNLIISKEKIQSLLNSEDFKQWTKTDGPTIKVMCLEESMA
ncbi:hypothetical protein RyT2_11170 [Pseudolactococcus yaeyamensis]